MKKLILTALISLIIIANYLYSQDAKTILNKVDENISGWKDMQQTLQITLVDKSQKKETRTALLWQKGEDKRLIKFTSPESQKGIGFLSLPNETMYLYMPSFGKERRIASSIKNQKFAGTDLTYDDLQAKKYSQKYSSTLINSTNSIFTIELVPLENSEYKKIVMSINAKDYLPQKAEFYNKAGKMVKTIEFYFEKEGKYWYTKKMVVVDLLTNHSTILESTNVKFDQNLKDDIFTIKNLMN